MEDFIKLSEKELTDIKKELLYYRYVYNTFINIYKKQNSKILLTKNVNTKNNWYSFEIEKYRVTVDISKQKIYLELKCCEICGFVRTEDKIEADIFSANRYKCRCAASGRYKMEVEPYYVCDNVVTVIHF